MELIDKAAVVAEIEKRFNEYSSSILKHYDACTEARASELGKILVILNTIEVKEVDLEKEIDDYIYTHDGRKRLALELDWKYCNLILKGGDEIIKFAKHFFELGLKVAQKEEE